MFADATADVGCWMRQAPKEWKDQHAIAMWSADVQASADAYLVFGHRVVSERAFAIWNVHAYHLPVAQTLEFGQRPFPNVKARVSGLMKLA